MAPLINQPTTQPATTNQPTGNTQPAGVPASVKSTLAASTAMGVLGYFSASPKLNHVNLLELADDKFEKETKKIEALEDTNPMKKALKEFLKLKESLSTKTNDYISELFGEKTSIGVDDIKSALNTEDLAQDIKNIDNQLLRIKIETTMKLGLDQHNLMESIVKNKDNITEDVHKLIDALGEEFKSETTDLKFLDNYKQKLKEKFPIGGKIENPQEILTSILDEETNAQIAKIKELRDKKTKLCILSRVETAAKEGALTKEQAEKIIKQGVTDYNLDNFMDKYSKFADKLPKARLKSVAKYFGLGFLTITITDSILDMFTRKKSNKQ